MEAKCETLEPASRTVRVSSNTYQELCRLGTFGDSFDSIIRSLLNHENSGQRGADIPLDPDQTLSGTHSLPQQPRKGREYRD